MQRHRIRDTLHIVDPEGVHNRLRVILHRRRYSVPSPNALWHVDGYHKLIPWKFVVHGGIDGYSRVVTYLQASTNNTAQTALSAFLEGVGSYGIPLRVRSDHGGENNLIAEYMVQQRGAGRGSIIMGRSVHNQRIERDLFTGCVSYFYYLFYHLEGQGLLNPDDNADILALHLTFLPKLQKQLDSFRLGWCHHRLRTEHNRTLHQLWLQGMLELETDNPVLSGLDVDVSVINVYEATLFTCLYMCIPLQVSSFGIDYEGPIDTHTVQLDDLPPLLSAHDRDQLSQILSDMELESPEQEDNWLGQYAVACSFIHSVL